MNLCKYKDFFGKPNECVHSYRSYNIALVDFITIIIIGYLISIIFKLNLFKVLIILFILGIFFNWLFCVKTTVHNII